MQTPEEQMLVIQQKFLELTELLDAFGHGRYQKGFEDGCDSTVKAFKSTMDTCHQDGKAEGIRIARRLIQEKLVGVI